MQKLHRIFLCLVLLLSLTVPCAAQIGVVFQATNYPTIEARGEFVKFTSESSYEYSSSNAFGFSNRRTSSSFHLGVEAYANIGFSQTDVPQLFALPVGVGGTLTIGSPTIRGIAGFGMEGSLVARPQGNMITLFKDAIPLSQWYPQLQTGALLNLDGLPIQLRATISGLLLPANVNFRGGLAILYRI